MSLIAHILNNRRLLHTLYWITAFCFFCIYGLGHNQPLIVSFYVILVDLPVQIIASYVFIYLQLPFLFKKQYFKFIGSFILLAYIFYLMVHFNHDYGIGTRLISWHKPHTISEILAGKDVLFRNLADIYIVVFVTGAIKFIKANLESRKTIEQLQSEMASVNYNRLKSKVDSEFILSSLQEIIALSKDQKDDAPATIARLSEVLDDALYGTSTDKRSLFIEAEQLEHYLELSDQVHAWLHIHSIETHLTDPTLSISTRSLHEILQIIINECSKNHKELAMELMILNEDSKCVLQVEFKRDIDGVQLSSKLEEYLSQYFAGRYELNLESDESDNNLLIKLAL